MSMDLDLFGEREDETARQIDGFVTLDDIEKLVDAGFIVFTWVRRRSPGPSGPGPSSSRSGAGRCWPTSRVSGNGEMPPSGYLTTTALEQCLIWLNSAYPNFTQLFRFGTSELGRMRRFARLGSLETMQPRSRVRVNLLKTMPSAVVMRTYVRDCSGLRTDPLPPSSGTTAHLRRRDRPERDGLPLAPGCARSGRVVSPWQVDDQTFRFQRLPVEAAACREALQTLLSHVSAAADVAA